MAVKRLIKEYKTIQDDINYLYSCNIDETNVLLWNFMIIGPVDTLYEGGIFTGYIKFPEVYPIKPPSVFFNNILHPNIYKNGQVCISTLHEGSDSFGYEEDNMRWRPSHGVNSIMMSIISLLSAPNFDSPANIDASKLWKNNINEYKKIIYRMVAQSQ